MDKCVTIQDVFERFLPEFAEVNNFSYRQYQVVNCITKCRTAEMGAHVTECEKCQNKKIHYNSCKNRHCPMCQQGIEVDEWIDKQQENVLDTPYFHVVFTIPDELNPLVYVDFFDGIEFDHVSFKYPGSKEYVLKNINLKISKGEKISIVGMNGAGKSTLIKLLCRLYDVTEGQIKICGRNINDYSYEEYVKILAVVFQDFKLFGYTIDENIEMGNQDKKRSDLEHIYQISGIADWVHRISDQGNTLLYKAFDEKGIEPSGGQAQKIAIARAVYRNAPIVVLDEPTAALDPVAEYEIYNRFNELINNKTTIYISHRMSSCKFCDRIIVIGDKTIQEEGTHNELMKKKGIYEQMFETQAKWYVEA